MWICWAICSNKCRNRLRRLRLPVQIRGFPRTGIFSCHQQLGCLIFHVFPPKTCFLNISKKCQKYAKLLYILSLLLQVIFFVVKLSQPEKNAYSTSETKWKCIITHVLTNLKTCNKVTIKHPEVFNCVLHHLV